MVRWYSGSNILGYSVSKLVITKLGCVHETQLKPVGIGLGLTESVERKAGTKYQGTIRAYFTKVHLKGMKPTNPFQGDRKNGGGSSITTSNLKTTMKKVRNSKKKMGVLPKRGAKSRMVREQLTREQKSVSSQMEIRHFFSKKVGIIGSELGRSPMGDGQKPSKTRKF